MPGDIIKINNSRSIHDLFFAKYLGQDTRFDKLVHIFVPQGEEDDYKEEYDSYYECDVLYLDSLDQLMNYIIMETDGSWFIEFYNLNKNSYSCIKYNKIIDMNNILLSRDNSTLPRLYTFEILLNMPNDPLPAIGLKEISQDLYQVFDGNHRIEYSKIKGYTHIPAILL